MQHVRGDSATSVDLIDPLPTELLQISRYVAREAIHPLLPCSCPERLVRHPPSRCWSCADSLDRKVAVVLEELGLTYHSIYLDFEKTEQKSPEHTKYNPNGRIPTIIDHKNNDFVLWYVSCRATKLRHV